jgi:hypothetical protein
MHKTLPALAGVLALVATLSSCSLAPSQGDAGDAASAFCSPEALMELMPSLRNDDGKLEFPDPGTDLQGFYDVHQALTRAIDVALTQAQGATTPQEAASQLHETLTFGPQWRSAEVGASTTGTLIYFPNDGRFASYGGTSFLSGIRPIEGTGNSMYEVVDPEGNIGSLVLAQPTELPCINRILLAEESSAGTWMPPSYALGPEGGEAFLVVDLCVDLADIHGDVMAPGASLFVALQWADIPEFAHMRTDQESLMHRNARHS